MRRDRAIPNVRFRRVSPVRQRRAFMLLEIIFAVAIFSIGVMSLAMAVNNCLDAEIARAQDQRARLALENAMASIENGETDADQARTAKLEGMFTGMTLEVRRDLLNWKNENDQDLTGLNEFTLQVSWLEGTQTQKKTLKFYVLRSQ